MCKESAKELRSKLKEIGYNRNMVSVTSDYDSINVTVKSIEVDFKKVEKLANSYESFRTDERTGEILCGGNTFVFVSYDYKLDLTEDLIEKVKSLPIINFGSGCDDRSKYYHYSRELAEILGWSAEDAGHVLTRDYNLCKEIYERKN